MPVSLKYDVKRFVAAALAAGAFWVTATPLGQAARVCDVRFSSVEAALDQGLNAYRGGNYGIAATALTCAAERGSFLARFHLARLYSDSASLLTDHSQAYELYKRIVDDHADKIDVDDDGRAPYVGKALTAFAGYWLRGLPQIGVAANPEQAAFYLQQAATFFREPDAQFELAKLYMKGVGVPEDLKKGLNWLAVLIQDGHTGAQAYFAELLWRGEVVQKDEQRALALSTIAVEYAPPHDRLWIETVYQQIRCGASPDVRRKAEELTHIFRSLYTQRGSGDIQERSEIGQTPPRICAGGEIIDMPKRESRAPQVSQSAPASVVAPIGTKPPADGFVGVGQTVRP